jgi:hypothetical protein
MLMMDVQSSILDVYFRIGGKKPSGRLRVGTPEAPVNAVCNQKP